MEPHCRHETTLCPHSFLSVRACPHVLSLQKHCHPGILYAPQTLLSTSGFLWEVFSTGRWQIRTYCPETTRPCPGTCPRPWLVKSDSSSTPRFLTLVTGTLPVLGFNHGENTHLRQHHGVNSDSLLHLTLMKNTGHTIKRATQIHPQQLSSQPTTLATVPTVTTPRFHSWCCNGQASP